MLPERGRAQSVRNILSSADIALYHAKDQLPPKVALFNEDAETPYVRRTKVEQALRTARPSDISLVFQPIVDLMSGKIIALEALARWKSDVLGEVAPSEFIPAAERLHLIEALNDQLLRKALREVEHFHPDVRLAFNLSAVQLASPEAAREILKAVSVAGVPSSRLQVEVTETSLLSDFEMARRNLSELRARGILIALDDFGAGYSSISYIREIRFDQIKLDGSYVTTAEHGQERTKLLGAVLGLCRALQIEPIAEHIETAAQLKTLQDLGCQYGQGFYLCEPNQAKTFYGIETLSM
jgi:predicted signal transduction protein with EAL and GGDEF domain